MSFFSNWIWEQWRNTHIPKDLWYADQHNGCAIVVRAWEMERAFQLEHADPRKGIPTRPRVRTSNALHLASLVFSDLPSYRNSNGDRTSDGVVGSLEEFKTFCYVFPVQLRSLEIPVAKDLRHQGRVMSNLGDPFTFQLVLNYAQERCRVK